MEEISGIEPTSRLEFFKQNCDRQGVHALFKHALPTEEEKKKMRDKNNLHAKGQPKGQLDLDKFEQKGSYGFHLREHVDKESSPSCCMKYDDDWNDA